MITTVNTHVKSLNWKIKIGLGKQNVEYFNYYATVESENTINLDNGKNTKKVTSKYILVCVGGRPFYPDI